jgi:hypothetical protein
VPASTAPEANQAPPATTPARGGRVTLLEIALIVVGLLVAVALFVIS